MPALTDTTALTTTGVPITLDVATLSTVRTGLQRGLRVVVLGPGAALHITEAPRMDGGPDSLPDLVATPN